MKTVTFDKLMSFLSRNIRENKSEWSALDVLKIESLPIDDRLKVVLREDFIESEILHEFACLCAEKALSLVEKTYPICTDGIEAKRKWLRGEISDDEMHVFSVRVYGMPIELYASPDGNAIIAAQNAIIIPTNVPFEYFCWNASLCAAIHFASTSMDASDEKITAWDTGYNVARNEQVEMLSRLLAS